jgi:DNA-binding protein HU-beta
MTKSQIVAHLAERAGVTKVQTAALLQALADLSYVEAKNGFTVPGIGKLVLVHRQAREGRNPSTGEKIQIPAKSVVRFRVSKICKDAIITV